MNNINWEDFDSIYWSPEKGRGYDLVLANWRQEWKQFEDDKEKKAVISFDVLKVGTNEFAQGEKVFSTGAKSFASKVREIIEKAEKAEEKAINIYLEYGTDNKYKVADLKRVRGSNNN